MIAQIIDGKAIAAEIRVGIAAEVKELSAKTGKVPGLAVVLVGEDAASKIYVGAKEKAAKEAGFNSYNIVLPSDTSEKDLLRKVAELNEDANVHGMIVQLPLPSHIKESAVINAIDPRKDADGFHISNVGKLNTGQDGLVPCTPLGCMILLKKVLTPTLPSPASGGGLGWGLAGKNALVIGRSNIVGKPMAALLLRENCTVTIAHSKTKNLPELCGQADIIVAAVGKANLVKGEWIKPGAALIDVGMNRENGKLCGDIDFASAVKIAAHITPVPGGVGPMTIACLLGNTLKAFKSQLIPA